tara:strand:- start:3548 stop:4165 length:618 start_codon:yes stop_codon:yes gene_type:complete
MILNFNTKKCFNLFLISLLFIGIVLSLVTILSNNDNLKDNIDYSIIILLLLFLIIIFYFIRTMKLNKSSTINKYESLNLNNNIYPENFVNYQNVDNIYHVNCENKIKKYINNKNTNYYRNLNFLDKLISKEELINDHELINNDELIDDDELINNDELIDDDELINNDITTDIYNENKIDDLNNYNIETYDNTSEDEDEDSLNFYE